MLRHPLLASLRACAAFAICVLRRSLTGIVAVVAPTRQFEIASYLSRKRDRAAALTFFRRAVKRHGQPRTITLDGFEQSRSALRRMGMRNEFNFRGPNPVKIRSCQYLNNIVEEDHRRVKFRVSAMLGFKSFQRARRILAGLELIQKLKKRQYAVPFSFGFTSHEIWRHVLAS